MLSEWAACAHAEVMVQVVYLDLRKVRIDEKACSLINVGPCACLAGEVAAVPGQQGAPSTANFLHAQTYIPLLALLSFHSQADGLG